VPWFADVCGLCPLTAETEKLIDADALSRMKPSGNESRASLDSKRHAR
jgi:lactate dehydrogenase-like 2-hydroxyacid dehydrogenase